MRISVLAACAAAAISTAPMAASAQSIGIGPGGVRIDDGRDYGRDRGRYRRESCRDLREACLNKDRLGEQGEGNCRRYRNACR